MNSYDRCVLVFLLFGFLACEAPELPPPVTAKVLDTNLAEMWTFENFPGYVFSETTGSVTPG